MFTACMLLNHYCILFPHACSNTSTHATQDPTIVLSSLSIQRFWMIRFDHQYWVDIFHNQLWLSQHRGTYLIIDNYPYRLAINPFLPAQPLMPSIKYRPACSSCPRKRAIHLLWSQDDARDPKWFGGAVEVTHILESLTIFLIGDLDYHQWF